MTCTRCGENVGTTGVLTVDIVIVDGARLHEFVRECHDCAKGDKR